MKYRSLLTVALIISSAMTLSLISAEVEQTTQQARPYQPFTPVAIYQGGFYPVIGVEDDEPLISVEGRLLSLGKDAAVYFWSNNTYVTPSIDTEHQIDRDIGPKIPNQYSKGRSQGFEDPIQTARD